MSEAENQETKPLQFEDMLQQPQEKVDDLIAQTLYQDEHAGDYYDNMVSPPEPYDRDMGAAQMCTHIFFFEQHFSVLNFENYIFFQIAIYHDVFEVNFYITRA